MVLYDYDIHFVNGDVLKIHKCKDSIKLENFPERDWYIIQNLDNTRQLINTKHVAAVVEKNYEPELTPKIINEAIACNHGDTKKAAEDLGISHRTLYRKMKHLEDLS